MTPSSCFGGSTATSGSRAATTRSACWVPSSRSAWKPRRETTRSWPTWTASPGSSKPTSPTNPVGASARTRRKTAAVAAYFSAEFGLTECLSIFAGGLGILAGDHLKSASDLGVPLVGVGLLYQQGYFRQYLNEAGWQQEFYQDNDFHNLPLSPSASPTGRR